MDVITFKAIDVQDPVRDKRKLRHWLHAVARDHGHRIQELNYVLMDDEALLGYNRLYLGHDEYTDVITFDGNVGSGITGDVLMSVDRIRENAKGFGVPLQEELRRVMVHGLLHLLGHGDRTRADKAAMRATEDRYLARLR